MSLVQQGFNSIDWKSSSDCISEVDACVLLGAVNALTILTYLHKTERLKGCKIPRTHIALGRHVVISEILVQHNISRYG